MCDILTIIVASIGIFLGFLDIAVIWFGPTEDDKIKKYVTKNLKKMPDNCMSWDILLKDYEITNSEVARRENITVLVGTIMLTSSFLILGNSITQNILIPRFVVAAASIFIFVTWLFILYYTTRKLNQISYTRIRAFEDKLNEKVNYGFGIHRFMQDKRKCQLKFRIRKCFWSVTLLVLSIAWYLVGIYIY